MKAFYQHRYRLDSDTLQQKMICVPLAGSCPGALQSARVARPGSLVDVRRWERRAGINEVLAGLRRERLGRAGYVP